MLADADNIRAKRKTLKKSTRLSCDSFGNAPGGSQQLPNVTPPRILLPKPYDRFKSTSHQTLTELTGKERTFSCRIPLCDIPWRSLNRANTEEISNSNRLNVNRKHSRPYGSSNQFFRVSSDLVRLAGNHRYRNLLSRPSQERSSFDSEVTRSTATPRSSVKSASRLDRNDTFNVTIDSINSRDPPQWTKVPLVSKSQSVDVSAKRNLMVPKPLGLAHNNNYQFMRRNTKKRTMSYQEAQIGLWRRKQLLERRTACNDTSVLLAIIGIILMMLEGELTARDIFSKDSVASNAMKTLIVISTIMLLCVIILYHTLEIQLLMIESGAEDWKVTVSFNRIIKVLQECFICCVCPLPGTSTISWPYVSGYINSTETSSIGAISDASTVQMTQIPLDVLLSIPMFLRCYLVGRSMVLHSKQFQDASTRSIAALNQVSVDVKFVTRSLMKENPVVVLVVVTTIYWLVISWCYTQCERYRYRPGDEANSLAYLHSLWLIIVTFLSIGYGDMVPHTFCGRSLASITGIVGIFVASALIATVTNMLELTKAEKHVNAFMADSYLQRWRRDVAATVLQHTWMIYRYRVLHPDLSRTRAYQRKFLHSIKEFQHVKWQQRKLAEENNNLIDPSQIHHGLQLKMQDLQNTQEVLLDAVQDIRMRLDSMETLLRELRLSCKISGRD